MQRLASFLLFRVRGKRGVGEAPSGGREVKLWSRAGRPIGLALYSRWNVMIANRP